MNQSPSPEIPTSTTVRTTCPYCGVGCGVLASIDETGAVIVQGDPEHPANLGRLCSKGSALGETVYHHERLLYPEIAGEQVSWDEAIAASAALFRTTIEQHGPESVAFYVSGQLLTEDYYVANKLMKGFIGSGNIDTNSRLCMSSAVAGYKRAFGEDAVPCSYEDLERARMIVLTGSNTAWCHPVLFQRIVRAKKENPDLFIVSIDPRETQTASIADLHLALKPGTDGTLFNGLLTALADAGETNALFTANFTNGMDEALSAARASAPDIATVARTCELPADKVERFYKMFSRTERVVTVFSQGINQSSSGVDKINAIINCHLLTGRIGRPGMGPFSFTGQPNAMGGREVGGLANQLAAHMDIANPDHRSLVQDFWQSPVIADKEGLKAVDLFNAIAEGKIKAVWIMATNPAVSLPEADKVKAALEQCELVVVSDCVRNTDTAKLADILLPALSWGEKDGMVTNSERRISRQRKFLPEPGLAKPDWWIITRFARQLGYAEQFPYEHPDEIFREHAALSGYQNQQTRLFDISALAEISAQEYDNHQPVQWPVSAAQPTGSARLFSDGRFSTPDHRAQFIAVNPRPPALQPSTDYPFVLNTGRIRDQWHTMSRTGMSPRLSTHTYEPYVEIHPDDAQEQKVQNGALVQVRSPHGEIFVRTRISEKQQRGSLFVPIHWNDSFASNARVDTLVAATTDPISGQPESKHSIARLENSDPLWQGFILTRRNRLNLEYASYWARSRGKGLWRYEVAGKEAPENWADRAHALLSNKNDNKANWSEFFDSTQQQYRGARFLDDKLESIIFIGKDTVLPERDWLIRLFQNEALSREERRALLSGMAPSTQEDTGRIICACFSVGIKTIEKTIKEERLTTVEDIGKALQAGTNCGSCIPELKSILST
ncbi:MAG: molybdopterin-dependent oxidoreductase [bacterium]